MSLTSLTRRSPGRWDATRRPAASWRCGRASACARAPRFAATEQDGLRIAEAFLQASREGDLGALRQLLADDAVLHSDGGGKKAATLRPVMGGDKVARFFAGIAGKPGGKLLGAAVVRLNGMPAVLGTEADGLPRSISLDIQDGRIVAVYMVRNPDKLRHVAALAPRQSTEPDAPLSPERYDLNLPALDLPGLRLRAMREADADDWHDYLRLEEVTRHTSWRLDGPATLSALIRAYAEPARSNSMRLAIAGPDDRLVGTIGLNEISIPHRRAEIAYDLAPTYWGRGVASEACRKLAEWPCGTWATPASRPRCSTPTRLRCGCWNAAASSARGCCTPIARSPAHRATSGSTRAPAAGGRRG